MIHASSGKISGLESSFDVDHWIAETFLCMELFTFQGFKALRLLRVMHELIIGDKRPQILDEREQNLLNIVYCRESLESCCHESTAAAVWGLIKTVLILG